MALVVGGIARAVMRAALPSLIKEGLSGAASIRHFASWGYGIRKQDFYGIFRSVTAQVKQEDKVTSLNKNKPVPKSVFEKADISLSKDYLYNVRFNVYDEDGSFVDYKTFSYSTDLQLEPAEIEEIMSFAVNETTSGEQGWTYAEPTLIGALRR